MPTYEMPFLIRVVKKPELVSILKRTAESIFSKGGFIRNIDNLGKQQQPYKITAGSVTHKEANYFIFHFDIPPTKIQVLLEEYNRDVDILKCNIYNKANEVDAVSNKCTLHEELLPPAYRPEVQEIIASGEKLRRRKERNKFKMNTGLDYYPFQR